LNRVIVIMNEKASKNTYSMLNDAANLTPTPLHMERGRGEVDRVENSLLYGSSVNLH
jgi:hypothetical protein